MTARREVTILTPEPITEEVRPFLRDAGIPWVSRSYVLRDKARRCERESINWTDSTEFDAAIEKSTQEIVDATNRHRMTYAEGVEVLARHLRGMDVAEARVAIFSEAP